MCFYVSVLFSLLANAFQDANGLFYLRGFASSLCRSHSDCVASLCFVQRNTSHQGASPVNHCKSCGLKLCLLSEQVATLQNDLFTNQSEK